MTIADKVSKAGGITDAELRNMKPDKVDGIIDELDGLAGNVLSDMDRTMVRIHVKLGDQHTRGAGWNRSDLEAIRAARKGEGEVKALAATYDDARLLLARINAAIERLDGEYRRRGRWPRAFIVTDGHIHSSRGCSTCNKGEQPTKFEWLVNLSGMQEPEIVERAADRACTVCYPDAPVARGLTTSVSSLSTKEERDRQAERENKQRIRDEKAAKAALNAITDIDGKPLREDAGKGFVLKTIRSARTRLKDECWRQYAWGDAGGSHEEAIQHLARAIAWREAGLPLHLEPSREQIDAVIEPVRVKAVKEVEKARKQGR